MWLKRFLFLMLVIVSFTGRASASEPATNDVARAMEMLEQEPPDATHALPILRQAAQNGNAEAAYDLGVALYTVDSVQNPAEAVQWFKVAVKAGDVKAAYNLATAYEDNPSLKGDATGAYILELYRSAASGGIVHAMHRLGIVLAQGTYSKPDTIEGLAWLLLAKNYGDEDTAEDIGELQKAASAAQIADAEKFSKTLQPQLEANPVFLNNLSL